jgi:uncharacterized protein YbaR (Trm112 family)
MKLGRFSMHYAKMSEEDKKQKKQAKLDEKKRVKRVKLDWKQRKAEEKLRALGDTILACPVCLRPLYSDETTCEGRGHAPIRIKPLCISPAQRTELEAARGQLLRRSWVAPRADVPEVPEEVVPEVIEPPRIHEANRIAVQRLEGARLGI